MKGLLSPRSKSNCQNLSPYSPSHKMLYSPTLQDSCNSLNYSCMIQSQTKPNKFYSFKKIKEQRIKQKNQQGRIIKQMVYTDSKKQKKVDRLKTLDDAKTIQSHNSPRSSISGGKRIIQESIILMRGRDLEDLVKQTQEDNFICQDQPQTPFFKRRNTFNEEIKIRSDFLKPISINPSLLRSIQSGLIFHYEIVKMPASAYFPLMNIKHEGILQVYSAIDLKSCVSHISLVIYQPYNQTLSEKLLKTPEISFNQLLTYMTSILKILTQLKTLCIHPQIEPTTILLSNSSIKIKLRSECQQTQRETLRQCGYYFSSLMRNIGGGRGGGIGSGKGMGLGMGMGMGKGMSMRRRLEFENLMEEFIRNQECGLEEAYLKVRAMQG